MKKNIFQSNKISARAKGIYAFLITNKEQIKKSDLSNYFKEGRDSLNTACNELIDYNIISIEYIRDEKGKFVGSYIKITEEE